jgi:endonuclease YncB( thermonuclease family)
MSKPAAFSFWPKALPYSYGPYRAVVDRVIDGDTFVSCVDVGLECYPFVAIRLFGCDAPEMEDEGGEAAREYLEEMLPPGSPIVIRTQGRSFARTFERWVASVLAHDGLDVATEMVRSGHATWTR